MVCTVHALTATYILIERFLVHFFKFSHSQGPPGLDGMKVSFHPFNQTFLGLKTQNFSEIIN